MTANLRKGLYGLIPVIVAAFVAYGWLTAPQAAAVGQVAALVLGVAYAALNASGNRLLDPATRRAIYLAIAGAGVIPLAWGVDDSMVTLWINLALGIVSAVISIWNVDPDEVVQTVPGDTLPEDSLVVEDGTADYDPKYDIGDRGEPDLLAPDTRRILDWNQQA